MCFRGKLAHTHLFLHFDIAWKLSFWFIRMLPDAPNHPPGWKLGFCFYFWERCEEERGSTFVASCLLRWYLVHLALRNSSVFNRRHSTLICGRGLPFWLPFGPSHMVISLTSAFPFFIEVGVFLLKVCTLSVCLSFLLLPLSFSVGSFSEDDLFSLL